jgi:biuret amidohydrolase
MRRAAFASAYPRRARSVTRSSPPPDYQGVAQNAEIFRRVVASGAMKEGSWGAEFFAGLGPVPGELVVTHHRNNPFHGSPLADAVALFRPRRLVMAGISTTYVVESAVRHAADCGYEVLVASDACSSASPAMHEASLAALTMLARIATVDEILAEWTPP